MIVTLAAIALNYVILRWLVRKSATPRPGRRKSDGSVSITPGFTFRELTGPPDPPALTGYRAR